MVIGYSFSVAGLLFPYHIGVCSAIRGSDLYTPRSPVNGASGGALAACCLAAGLPDSASLAASQSVADECTERGAFLNLGSILKSELDSLVTDKLIENLNARPGLVSFSYTAFDPLPSPRLARPPFDCETLKASLRASSHIPLYSSVSPVVRVKEELCVDGFVSSPATLGMRQEPGAEKTGEEAPTHTPACAAVDSTNFFFLTFASLAAVFVTPFAGLSGVGADLIAPREGEVPFPADEYVALALGRPGPSEAQHELLFSLGVSCAERWIEESINSNIT